MISEENSNDDKKTTKIILPVIDKNDPKRVKHDSPNKDIHHG